METVTVTNTVAPVRHAPKAVPAPSLRSQFVTIEREMNATFAEREKEIRGLIIATLAGEHILLLGPAGTAKSALANTFCDAIDGSVFFQYLLTRFSAPEEVFGPVSLDGLKNDVFRRVTSGKLPECNVAFLDEIYKANSAILNALLTALNERKFDNAGGRRSIPLMSAVGASNELPEGPELAALHDRFLLRYWVTYTKTPDAFRRLLTGAEPSIASKVTITDLRFAQSEVEAVKMTDTAVDELFRLRVEVGADNITASDRRWRKAVRILKAAAWLDGATEVTPESFPILQHVLWEQADQIPKLAAIVAKYTSAELAEVQEIADTVLELVGNIPPKSEKDEYTRQLVSVTRELKKAGERIAKLEKQCGGVQSKARIAVIRSDVENKYNTLKRDAASALDL